MSCLLVKWAENKNIIITLLQKLKMSSVGFAECDEEQVTLAFVCKNDDSGVVPEITKNESQRSSRAVSEPDLELLLLTPLHNSSLYLNRL